MEEEKGNDMVSEERFVSSDFDLFTKLRTEYRMAATPLDGFETSPTFYLDEYQVGHLASLSIESPFDSRLLGKSTGPPKKKESLQLK